MAMSSNVGLPTPRGSGTSGYVQRNMSALKPRNRQAPYPQDGEVMLRHRQRQPNKEILEHDRKRAIEVKVLELRDSLEDEGVEEDEIDERADELRKKLEAEDASKTPRKGAAAARSLKTHQVHELAEAKIEETERLRKALGISQDYKEGDHWRKQEQRMMDSVASPSVQDESKR